MRILRPSLLLLTITLSACASSPEVKLASAEMTNAINEYDRNITVFEQVWLAEIDRVRVDLGQAIIARSVKLKIDELSGSFNDPQWELQFQEHGLVTLSEQIEEEQRAASDLVAAISRKIPGPDETGEDALQSLGNDMAAGLRASAAAIAESSPESAAELEQRANELEQSGGLFEDQMSRALAVSLLEWNAARSEIPGNLGNLRALVAILKETHSVVDDWIMTDVTVSGAEVAKLFEDSSALLNSN